MTKHPGRVETFGTGKIFAGYKSQIVWQIEVLDTMTRSLF
jgi:hypothetical protein